MSSLLYQLSYNLEGFVFFIENKNADKGFAPLYTGHEPIMLLLHQSAIIYIYNNINQLYKLNVASEGIEPSYVMMKTLCLNHLTIRPIIINK